MDPEQFRSRAIEIIDYVINYRESVRDVPPVPEVKPGFLHKTAPQEAPKQPESWKELFKDIDNVIMPGVSCRTM